MQQAFLTTPQYGSSRQQAGPTFTPPLAPLPQPSSTQWFWEWDPQSLAGCFSSTVFAPPTPMTNWVVDFDATNHTTPYPDHIYSP
jgi:hypothetical protein